MKLASVPGKRFPAALDRMASVNSIRAEEIRVPTLFRALSETDSRQQVRFISNTKDGLVHGFAQRGRSLLYANGKKRS